MPKRPSIAVGDVFVNNCNTKCVVVEYIDKSNVVVEFQDEYKDLGVFQAQKLREGKFKNLFDKTVCGVGFIGKGVYKAYEKGVMTDAYRHWTKCMSRCYNKATQKANPYYLGCTVKKEWHNFQSFAAWFYSQAHYRKDYQLDKDILVRGCKVYSKDTCLLVPKEINFLVNSRDKLRGLFPVGVHQDKRSGSFVAGLSKNNRGVLIGTFKTPEEAFYAYKHVKEAHIKDVANQYKDQIDPRAYNALMSYEVNIDD